MAFSSLPNSLHFPTLISNSNYLKTASFLTTDNYLPPPPLSTKRRGSVCAKCHGSGAEPGNKDGPEKDPLETIDTLYKAIKNKGVAPLSDIVADQLPHISNFFPFLRIFQTNSKKSNFFSNMIKAFNTFSIMIKAIQNSLIFTVHPTTKDGSVLGIKWTVGWNKPATESEKGDSIHSHYSYVEKLLIGNLETIIDPLLRLGPNTLKNLNLVTTKQRRVASLCLGFFLLLLLLFFFQFSVR